MYLDGKIGITNSATTLTRVQTYMMMLDQAMESMIAWSQGQDLSTATTVASPQEKQPAVATAGKGMVRNFVI
jgi:D-serine deaminase-like pyridoxal phosphate-dependent protein